MATRLIATSLESTVKLNDGVVMPLFGLGVYKIENNCISYWIRIVREFDFFLVFL